MLSSHLKLQNITNYFGFVPSHFSDEIINFINKFVYESIEEIVGVEEEVFVFYMFLILLLLITLITLLY